MTPLQHVLLGPLMNIVVWELWLKRYFYDKEEYQQAKKFLKRFF